MISYNKFIVVTNDYSLIFKLTYLSIVTGYYLAPVAFRKHCYY